MTGAMRLKLAAVLAVTIVCMVAALWGVDPERALSAVTGADPWFALPMLAGYLIAHALRALRLSLLLGSAAPRYGRLFAINTVGFLAINVIPLRLGEMVRPYLLWEREGVALARGLAAIVLERLLDMTMLLLLLAGVTLLVDLPAGGITVPGPTGPVDVIAVGQRMAAVLVAVGLLGLAAVVALGARLDPLLLRLPPGPALVTFAERFRAAVSELWAEPARGAALVGISMAIWAITLGAVGAVMAAFDGLPVTVASVWTTWTITLAGMAAIPTPGFFGAYELFCSVALRLWGVDSDVARAFAIVLHLGQFGFITVLGSVFVVLEGLSLRDLVRR